MTGDETTLNKTIEAFVDAFNRHDVDGVMAFFADDCTMDGPRGPSPWGRRCVGRDEIREGVAERFAGLPDAHYGDLSCWACDDRGVAEWLLTGTSPDGKRVEVRGCDHLRFRAGKIVHKDSYWKMVDA